MEQRPLAIIEPDMQRLRELVRSAGVDDRDRPYLAALRTELARAEVVDAAEISPDVVSMNSQVRLRDGRRTWAITLVYPEDADVEVGRISVLAPLGAAVLGCRVGERVHFRVPGGDARSCDILAVDRQPAPAEHVRSP